MHSSASLFSRFFSSTSFSFDLMRVGKSAKDCKRVLLLSAPCDLSCELPLQHFSVWLAIKRAPLHLLDIETCIPFFVISNCAGHIDDSGDAYAGKSFPPGPRHGGCRLRYVAAGRSNIPYKNLTKYYASYNRRTACYAPNGLFSNVRSKS